MKTKEIGKLSKSFLSIALALVMVFGVGTSVATTTDTNVFGVVAEAAAVKLSATKKTVYYGSSVTLRVQNTKKTVKWSTSNKNVATVTSKGKVTGKGLGTAYIYAKVSGKTYKCKVTVKDRNQTASRSFKVNNGGYFVKGESTAKVSVKAPKYAVAKGYVYIQNSTGTTVFSKTYSKMAKGKTYSFNWNGKNTKGNYVPAGSYRVLVKLGTTKAYTSYLKFIAKNDFADGSGSKTNPFEIATVAQFNKIVKYPTAYFTQTEDLDFGYEAVGDFFSEDQPFNGTYDGNEKTISNIAGTEALFEYVGVKGTIKNVVIKNCSVVGTYKAIMVNNNYGKISNCNVNGTVTATVQGSDSFAKIGLMVYNNYGTISNCTTSGQVSARATGSSTWGDKADAGGLAYYNAATGKIISCTSEANVTADSKHGHYQGSCAGGITAVNDGLINDCEANGAIVADGYGDCDFGGGIAGENKSQILNSYYTGESSVSIAGKNNGTIA